MNIDDFESAPPLIKWAGGKRRLLHDIHDLVPSQFSRYFEPFFGGGAVFFSLLPAIATLSDTNAELIQMYVEVRDNPKKIVSCLRTMPNTEEDYYRIRSMKPRTDRGKAARLMYGTGGKDKQLSWLNFVNLRRNIVYHASSGKTLTIDELNQLEQYGEWLRQKKGELIDKIVGSIDQAGAE